MTDIEHNPQVLGDTPTDDDKLGFAEPAAHLADKIASFPADKPMVVGIEGKWGEGKSSFLLMMEKHWREQACLVPKDFRTKFGQFIQEKILRKKPARQIKLIKFDPWWFSGKENLLDKLLKELEGQEPWFYSPLRDLLKSLEKQASADNTWLKPKLEIIALLLASGVSATLNPMLDWFGDSVSSTLKPWLQNSQAALLVLGLFWLIKAGLGLILAWLSPPEGFDARKKKLEELLKKNRFQRVVFVDDLDRLPTDELQEMFRVIKSVANFPNIVYVLAYDRGVVSAALNKFHQGKGELFLEKIVQLSFKLPVPEKEKVQQAYQEIFSLNPKMENFFKTMKQSDVSAQSWGLISSSLIHHTRHAKRLSFTLYVSFDSKIGIDIIYFLFLEALRLKNKALHVELCTALISNDFLADCLLSNDDNKKKKSEWLSRIVLENSVTPEEKQCLKFFVGMDYAEKSRSSDLWALFSGGSNRKLDSQKEQHRYIYRAMTSYMQHAQSSELHKLLKEGELILTVKTKDELINFSKHANSARTQEALRAYITSQPNQLPLKFRALLMLIAETFEYFYSDLADKTHEENHARILSYINLMATFLLTALPTDRGFLVVRGTDEENREYVEKFPLFYGKNEFQHNCIEKIWRKYPPEFFLRQQSDANNTWLLNMITWMVKNYKEHRDPSITLWLDKLPSINKNQQDDKLNKLYTAIHRGFTDFLANKKRDALPKILSHEKLIHLIPEIKIHFSEDAHNEKIIEEFEHSHKR